MRKILLAALVQLFVLSLSAQSVVKGRVVDETGLPLPGASVVIGTQGQSTDANGLFKFNSVSGKSAKIKVSFVGFSTVEQAVKVPFNGEIKLQKTSRQMDEVTVLSTRATDKSPVAYTNIGKETLAKSNLGQDVPYLLSMTPSFVPSSDAGTGIGYTNFRIRGTDATRINVTINGIPYNDADEQSTYWVDAPDLTSSVENLQVQRGVGTSTNGSGAFGANINMQTENYAPKASGELNVSYGSFNSSKMTAKASSGLMNNHWAIDTRLSAVSSDGYIDRASVNMKSYFLQAGYYGEKTTMKFLTFGGTEKTYHAWDGVPGDSLKTNRTYNECGFMGLDANGKPLFYKNQTDNYTQTNYQLLGVHSFSTALSLNAGLHYTRGDGYYEEYKQDQSLKKYALSPYTINGTSYSTSDLVRQKKMGNDFAGGVFSLNYSKEKLSAQFGGGINRYWGNHWGNVTWVKNYVGNVLPDLEYYRSRVSKWDANVYLKGNYELLPKLNVYGDLQYRRVTYSLNGTNDKWDSSINGMQLLDLDKKFNFFNPKAGLLYRPDSQNEVFASFALAHREPTRTNYTNAGSSEKPTSEALYDYELGYQFKSGNVSLGANLYYMYYKNQLILTGKVSDIGEALTSNIPESYRSGIELTAGVKITNWLKWDGNLTLSRNKIKNFTEYDVDVYDADGNWVNSQSNKLGTTNIAYSPTTIGNSLITASFKNIEVGLQSSYVGKQYIDNTYSNNRSLSSYFVNNLRINYTIQHVLSLKEIAFSLALNNLFNKQYLSNGYVWYSYYQGNNRVNDLRYFPQAGFNCLAGVAIRF
ncbi:MAG: TonB-dependent receptor [Bacteroidota bacterium]|nr:TonB-dependent receptor [Bacteroidota bacterium]